MAKRTEQAGQQPPAGRVLRFFGVPAQQVQAEATRAAARYGIHLACGSRGGETLAALSAPEGAPQRALQRVAHRLHAAFGADLYGEGRQTLGEACLQALQTQGRLLVCASAEAAQLLQPRLLPQEAAGQLCEFAWGSAAHSAPADIAAAAAQLQAALRHTGAGLAAGCTVPATPAAQPTWALLVGTRRGYWLRLVPAQQNPALWLLDMLRRAALGAAQLPGTQWLRYGQPLPAWAVQPQPATPPAGVPPQGKTAAAAAKSGGAAQSSQSGWKAEGNQPLCAAQREEYARSQAEAARRRRAKKRRGRLLAALGFALLAALAALAAAWVYTGGNWQLLLQWAGLREFSLSGASLLALPPGRL